MSMNYQEIGELHSPGEQERAYYRPRRDISKATMEEFMKAKAFLSVVSPTSNLSMYDHMRDLIERVLRLKVENAVDIFEDMSHSLKAEVFEQKENFLEIPELDDSVIEYISSISSLLESITPTKTDINADIRGPDEDGVTVLEDEDVDDKTEELTETEAWSLAFLHDVCHHMFRFRQNGVGLGHDEAYHVSLSIKALALRYKLDKVRFWGKIFGTTTNYYIAEAPYTEGIQIDDYGWKYVPTEDEVKSGTEKDVLDESMDADSLQEEEVKEKENKDETEGAVDESEKVPKIPPIPQPQVQQSPVLAEENGKGVNKFMYFVTTSPCSPWSCLPQLRPCHIVDARQLKRFFTGNLRTEVRGCMQFQGVEAHYLRAQIARVSASTILSPSGYQTKSVKDTENDLEEHEKVENEPVEEETKDEGSETEENSEYEARSAKDLFAEGLSGWAHNRQAIAPEGCCSWKNVVEEKADEEDVEKADVVKDEVKDADEEQEDELDKEEEPENAIPRLRLLVEDKGAGGIVPWTLKLSSKFLNECAVTLVRSNTWPGAFAYYDGNNFENIYIGYGHKYTVRHYAPKLGGKWQEEYEVGSDVIEPYDPISVPDPELVPDNLDDTGGENTTVSDESK